MNASVSRQLRSLAVLAFASTLLAAAAPVHAQSRSPHQQLAVEIFKQLVEMDTSSDTGDSAKAADAMAARLRDAGFAPADAQVFKPAARKGNLVARLRGSGARRPILLLAHLDVVPALDRDWSMPPFRFIEKDGYFYGRGTSDDKYMAANLVANLIRYRKEGFKPDRDIVVVLEADEEIGDRHTVGIRWLLKHQRTLIDAEYALNEGGGVVLADGRPSRVQVAIEEKYGLNVQLEVLDKGGHSSLPTPDNAIHRLAAGLTRLASFRFPIRLNEITRASFEREAQIVPAARAADIRALLAGTADAATLERLTAGAAYNARLRTTCVPTMLQGGHASNALPQTARATINCRVMPDETVDVVRAALVKALADDRISVSQPEAQRKVAPTAMNPQLMSAIERTAAEFWPGAPVVPVMAAGAIDGRFLREAGIPTFGHTGLAAGEMRAHGRDERVAVKSFIEGGEYLYRLVKRLTGGA